VITRTEKLVVASKIQAGRTYRKQTFDSTPFTVLVIADGYQVDEGASKLTNHRKAIVVDANGFYFMQPIYGNHRFIEIQSEQEQETMSDATITTESTETKSFEQQMQDALAQIEALRKASDEKRQQETEVKRAERIAKAKVFTDWLGIPGELQFDVERDAAYLVYQNVSFLISASVDRESVFVRFSMFRDLPTDEGFSSNWQWMRHQVDYGWMKQNDETRSSILVEIAEFLPAINAQYDAEVKRYDEWKQRIDSPKSAVVSNHTILFFHNGSGGNDAALCKKMDEGYRIVSMSAYGDENASGAYILLSKLEHPVVRQRVLDISDI
jgi:hypothetical protein